MPFAANVSFGILPLCYLKYFQVAFAAGLCSIYYKEHHEKIPARHLIGIGCSRRIGRALSAAEPAKLGEWQPGAPAD